MKIRSGFVSNSSSSSFIVAGPRGITPTVVIEVELPYSETLTTKKELDDYVMDNWSATGESLEALLEDDYYNDKYKACLKEIEKGNAIFIGSVSSEGSTEEQYLHENGIGETLKRGSVIEDCG